MPTTIEIRYRALILVGKIELIFNYVSNKDVCPLYNWLYSSFHRYVQRGVYDVDWGSKKITIICWCYFFARPTITCDRLLKWREFCC